jgi:ribosomal-protein-alanine N-acetyltransferase
MADYSKLSKMKIETDRMILIPMTFDFICDKMNANESFIEKQGIKINKDSWMNSDVIDILPILKDNLSKSATPDGYGAWLFILRESDCVIGGGGFKGAPDANRTIEIGYDIYEEYRRKGYATEAVLALINWARKTNGDIRITADCEVNNIASMKVLKKVGMKEIKRDDQLIHWTLS